MSPSVQYIFEYVFFLQTELRVNTSPPFAPLGLPKGCWEMDGTHRGFNWKKIWKIINDNIG
jgi:hypothetical protein